MKRSKKICLALIGCYLVLLVVATFCSIHYYQNHLTRVTLTVPQKGMLPNVIVKQEAEVQEDGLARMRVEKSLRIPVQALEEDHLLTATGQKQEGAEQTSTGVSQECRIVKCVDSEEEECYYVTLFFAGEVKAGEKLQVEIDCSNLKEYEWTLPGRALHLDEHGQYCVYVVEPQAGAWGQEYVLKEEIVLCFPQDLEAERVAIYIKPDKPIVDWTNSYVYEGMKVRLVDEEK